MRGGMPMFQNLYETPHVSSMGTQGVSLSIQGVGKTTACGKLALYLKQQKKSVLMVATDVYRPAAIDQLVKLGKVWEPGRCFAAFCVLLFYASIGGGGGMLP